MTPNEYGITQLEFSICYVVISLVYAVVLRACFPEGDLKPLHGFCGLLWPITIPFGIVILAGWMVGELAGGIVNLAEDVRDTWRRKNQ